MVAETMSKVAKVCDPESEIAERLTVLDQRMSIIENGRDRVKWSLRIFKNRRLRVTEFRVQTLENLGDENNKEQQEADEQWSEKGQKWDIPLLFRVNAGSGRQGSVETKKGRLVDADADKMKDRRL